MKLPPGVLACTWAAYLLCIVGAVLTYPRHDLSYGAFSWTGGALFTLLVLGHASAWSRR